MPDKKQRGQWWAFLEGRPQSEWNPPKKASKQKDNFSQGMRGFSSERVVEDMHNDTHLPYDNSQETWRINDEGEVEKALIVDPTDSLPTPSGTPAPIDPQAMDYTSAAVSVTEAAPAPTTQSTALRPTLSLLSQIDHVCNVFSRVVSQKLIPVLEIFTAPRHVFHTLDQHLSRAEAWGTVSDRGSRHLDILASRSS